MDREFTVPHNIMFSVPLVASIIRVDILSYNINPCISIDFVGCLNDLGKFPSFNII